MRPDDVFSLVADVGGTNTRVALARGTEVEAGSIRRYRNDDYPSIAAVIEAYVAEEHCVDCDGAAVCTAGPVRDEVGHVTNRGWSIDKPTLARVTKAERVAILNDLQAQGQAIGHVDPSKVRRLVDAPESGPHAAKLVIGVGTGFNAAPVWEAEQGRLVPPSECGHAGIPARSEADFRLMRYVSEEVEGAHGFPAVEEILSGRGVERIYAWLGKEEGSPRTLAAADIMALAKSGDDERAMRTAETFVRFLGNTVGNLALIHLPFGGIYMVGGVSGHFADYLAGPAFAAAMRDKGRFAEFMENFSVSLIEDDYAALTGLASFLARDVGAG